LVFGLFVVLVCFVEGWGGEGFFWSVVCVIFLGCWFFVVWADVVLFWLEVRFLGGFRAEVFFLFFGL